MNVSAYHTLYERGANMFDGEQIKYLVKKEHTPVGFARESLFYYRNFYQLSINDEFSSTFSSDDCFYFFYVTAGSLFVTLESEVFTLTKNDLLVVKKNVQIKLSSSQCEMYTCAFDGKIAPDYINVIVDKNHAGRSIVDFSNIVMFFVRLKELTMYDVQNDVYISLNLEAILVEIYARKYYGMEIENPQNYAIIQALFYVEQNISKKITLGDISEFVGYSIYHFSRLFKKEVGMPPYEYITRFRLDLAKHYLITTQKPIKDIAYECGYQNAINFYTLFKKNVGMSPKQFRNKNYKSEVKL